MIPDMGKKTVAILASNISRNIGPGRKFATILDLEKRSGVGKSTIDRIRKGETSARIDNLEALATAFGLSAWQLLVPELDPKTPPAIEGDGLPQKAREMVGLFDQLEEGQKDILLATARATIKQSDQRKSNNDRGAA